MSSGQKNSEGSREEKSSILNTVSFTTLAYTNIFQNSPERLGRRKRLQAFVLNFAYLDAVSFFLLLFSYLKDTFIGRHKLLNYGAFGVKICCRE